MSKMAECETRHEMSGPSKQISPASKEMRQLYLGWMLVRVARKCGTKQTEKSSKHKMLKIEKKVWCMVGGAGLEKAFTVLSGIKRLFSGLCQPISERGVG